MPAPAHELTNPREFDEVLVLGRDQWVFPEVRYHRGYQLSEISHFEFDRSVRSIRPYGPAIPQFVNDMEKLSAIGVLADRKARPNLPSQAMPPTGLERNAKTTLTIHKSRNIGIQIHKQSSEPACYELAA